MPPVQFLELANVRIHKVAGKAVTKRPGSRGQISWVLRAGLSQLAACPTDPPVRFQAPMDEAALRSLGLMSLDELKNRRTESALILKKRPRARDR